MEEYKPIIDQLKQENFKNFDDLSTFCTRMKSEAGRALLDNLPSSKEKTNFLRYVDVIASSLLLYQNHFYTTSNSTSDTILSFFNTAKIYLAQEGLIDINTINQKLDGQDWYLDRIKALYPASKVSDEGMCFGLATMTMQAFLNGAMNKCNYRLQNINNHPISNFENDFAELRAEKKRLIAENAFDKAQVIDDFIVDTQAFFDGIVIAFSPNNNSELFPDNLQLGQDIEASLALTLSYEAERNHDSRPEKVDVLVGSYSLEELTTYLDTLQKGISADISLMLGSNGHAINLNLAIDPISKQKVWYLMDPNNMPAKMFHSMKTSNMAETLFENFGGKNGIVMDTKIYTSSKNAKRVTADLKELNQVPEFLHMHDGSRADVIYGEISPFNLAVRLDNRKYLCNILGKLSEEEIKNKLNNPMDTTTGLAIEVAYLSGNRELTAFFLEQGASYTDNLVMYVINYKDTETFQAMLSQGLKPTLAHLENAYWFNASGIAEMIIATGIKPNEEQSDHELLKDACHFKNAEILALLLENKPQLTLEHVAEALKLEAIPTTKLLELLESIKKIGTARSLYPQSQEIDAICLVKEFFKDKLKALQAKRLEQVANQITNQFSSSKSAFEILGSDKIIAFKNTDELGEFLKKIPEELKGTQVIQSILSNSKTASLNALITSFPANEKHDSTKNMLSKLGGSLPNNDTDKQKSMNHHQEKTNSDLINLTSPSTTEGNKNTDDDDINEPINYSP